MTSPSIIPTYTPSPLMVALYAQIDVCSSLRLAIAYGNIEKSGCVDMANLERGLASAIRVKDALHILIDERISSLRA